MAKKQKIEKLSMKTGDKLNIALVIILGFVPIIMSVYFYKKETGLTLNNASVVEGVVTNIQETKKRIGKRGVRWEPILAIKLENSNDEFAVNLDNESLRPLQILKVGDTARIFYSKTDDDKYTMDICRFDINGKVFYSYEQYLDGVRRVGFVFPFVGILIWTAGVFSIKKTINRRRLAF